MQVKNALLALNVILLQGIVFTPNQMNFSPGILTLILDSDAQDYFNELRAAYFPPELNYLAAHLTLFHNIPLNEPVITDVINSICDAQRTFSVKVTTIVSIGNGVAYKVESDVLQAIHKKLQQSWQQWLIPQDRQKLWPHITIQNKTDATTAKQLLNELKIDFKPFEINALGFNLWAYKGGPWEFIQEYRFK